MQVANLIRDADQAIAGRDYSRAASLLEQAAAQSPSDMGLWMRVAAMRRGTGELDQALDAVHKALAINPREFMALLMRASLLQNFSLGWRYKKIKPTMRPSSTFSAGTWLTTPRTRHA